MWILRNTSRYYGCCITMVSSLEVICRGMVVDALFLMEISLLSRHIHVMGHFRCILVGSLYFAGIFE